MSDYSSCLLNIHCAFHCSCKVEQYSWRKQVGGGEKTTTHIRLSPSHPTNNLCHSGKELQTVPQIIWSWCILTLMVHTTDLWAVEVHSNNTCCLCLCPRDSPMRMFLLPANFRSELPGCSCCCCQHSNHGFFPDSYLRTQLAMAFLQQHKPLPRYTVWFVVF